jgi:hypothetical protein
MLRAPFWDGYCRYLAICIRSRNSCWLCRTRCCAPPAFHRASFSLYAILPDGTVPPLATIRRLSDAEIVERLSRVRGIGTWTAEMLLMFRLGRPDVFPGTDYGIRKGYLVTFGKVKAGKPISIDMLPKPEQMERRAARWKPWRSVASWYLWRAAELPPGSLGKM